MKKMNLIAQLRMKQAQYKEEKEEVKAQNFNTDETI